MATVTEKIKTKDVPEPTVSCKICVKADVCLIFRTVTGLADQFKDPTGKVIAPFKPENFAGICGACVPTFLVRTNRLSGVDVQ